MGWHGNHWESHGSDMTKALIFTKGKKKKKKELNDGAPGFH